MAYGTVKKIPEYVLLYVLLRLPVKLLMRLKCVSKTLYTLIKSSTFINLYLNHTTISTNGEFILFKRSIKEEPGEFKSILSFVSSKNDGDDLCMISPDLDISYLTKIYFGISHGLMGSCNGLIALTDEVNTVLFNPATRHYRVLQPNPFDCPLGFHHSIDVAGFGLDSIANDYKIVRVSVVHGEPPFYDFNMRERKVDVYELSVDSWREQNIANQHFPHVNWYPCSGVFYKGASHWFGNTTILVILCFDMSTEIFRLIEMPSACHFFDGKSYGLVILNGNLTLICYTCSWGKNDYLEDLVDIWIMKEYGFNESWTKKYTIIKPLSIESPLAVWKDHFLLFQNKNGLLISYDLKSCEVMEYNLHGWPESLRVTIYKECLTLIPKGNQHSTRVQNF